MSRSNATSSVQASSLSAHERFLVERSEEAIPVGLELHRWLRNRKYTSSLSSLNLKKQFELPHQARGFLSFVVLGGTEFSVMGTEQEIEFGRVEVPGGEDHLREFVLGNFLSLVNWTYEDGAPGGFTVEKSIYKTMDGEYGIFPPEQCCGCMDWRDLGTRYQWVLLTIHIHDLVMEFGKMRKRLKEALCAVAHPGFVTVQQNPAEGYALEVSVGYPVIKFAPIPNFFGYGPGKFHMAVKNFSFLLTQDQRLKVRMTFASAPRCEKVFDFGKRIPDPMYGGAALLSGLSLGLWKPHSFHDWLDMQMLVQHCRVHQTLMDGTHRVWSDWLKKRVSSVQR
ncbi:MAG: hypothetical protein A3F68_13485 [Acidobacteria bacterium RIFCSPLOWO2_12_FULL_54_10]|nr:MAG: hypothetical protein A3F68_13485 [Acidobacteria bacterium RIFCSPLOWO2_12_FULL_54_10]